MMEFQDHEIAPTNSSNLELWASAYNIIYLCNSYIEGLTNSTSIDAELQQQLENVDIKLGCLQGDDYTRELFSKLKILYFVAPPWSLQMLLGQDANSLKGGANFIQKH